MKPGGDEAGRAGKREGVRAGEGKTSTSDLTTLRKKQVTDRRNTGVVRKGAARSADAATRSGSGGVASDVNLGAGAG